MTRLLAYLAVVNVGRERALIDDGSIASLSDLDQQHPGS
jgi:hypothetical protein